MKKLVFLMMSLMLTISFGATAQNRQGKRNFRNDNRQRQEQRMNVTDRAEWMTKELDLTAAQKAEVIALFEKQDAKRTADVAKMKESREQMAVEREKAREEMRAMRQKEMEQNQEELKKIIGEENMKKLEAVQLERREANRQGSNRQGNNRQRPNRRGGRR